MTDEAKRQAARLLLTLCSGDGWEALDVLRREMRALPLAGVEKNVKGVEPLAAVPVLDQTGLSGGHGRPDGGEIPIGNQVA